MIVATFESSLRVVNQADHARFAAELLGLFRAEELRHHPQRALLLRAVGEHDNGWWEFDAAPSPGADGGPPDFRAVADHDRFEIWHRGVERYAPSEPGVAALVATHALRLFDARSRENPDWDSFLVRLRERREELAEAAGLSTGQIVELDRWMELADALALAATLGSPEPARRDGLVVEVEDSEHSVRLDLDPLPLIGATRLAFACRRIPRRFYSSAADLAGALTVTRWETCSVRIGPASPS